MKARIILMLVSILYVSITAAQNPPNIAAPPDFVQSATTASLGIYGSIPVSLFTGLADINLNVFTLKNHDLTLNASLRYFSGGVRTEDHPGWVGQNWSLNVGGVITRKIHGAADELDVSFPVNNENEAAYYYNYSKLNTADWFTQTGIIRASTANYLLLAPDEFDFTLPSGVSGAFYLNDQGVWAVKTKNGAYLTVSVQFNPQPIRLSSLVNPAEYIDIKRAFYAFTITDQDGVVYTFGNDPSAIEFRRGKRSTAPGLIPNNEDVSANAWYLTKITGPRGGEIDLTYQRKENQFIQSKSFYGGDVATTQLMRNKYQIVSCGIGQWNWSYGYSMITPCYLQEIKSSSFDIRFDIAQTTELRYNYRDDDAGTTNMNYTDLVWTDVDNFYAQSQWYQLNCIRVFDGSQKLKDNFSFTYNDDPTQRLFLQKFTRLDVSGSNGVDKVYSFDYNTTTLPAYNSFMLDNDGYYNGRIVPTDIFNSTSPAVNPNMIQALQTQTSPDSNYMQAGSLVKITYPTGGYTQFFYGPNYYSSQYQVTNQGVSLASKQGFGGGLRINKIIDHAADGAEYTKTYYYSTGDNPSVSSGISAGLYVHFFDVNLGDPALFTGSHFMLDPQENLDYTEGRPIVYSGVMEKLSDGSFTDYRFSNSDTQDGLDDPVAGLYSWVDGTVPIVGATAEFTWPSSNSAIYRSNTSKELERGQLLSRALYSPQGKLVYKMENQYNNDISRFAQYVKTYGYNGATIACTGQFVEQYIWASKIYTYYPYLKQQTESMYTPAGIPIVTTKTFEYDPVTRMPKKQANTDSKGMLYTTTFTYPSDYTIDGSTTNSISQGIQNLKAHNVVSSVIEKFTQRSNPDGSNAQPIESLFTSFKPTLTVPDVVYGTERTGPFTSFTIAVINATTASLDTRYKSIISYNQYDNNFNLTEQQKTGDMKEVFLWGYNGAYPVAKVVGSDYVTVKGFVNQSVLDNALTTDDATIRTELNKIRTGLAGTGALVTTYTYNALLGVSSETDPAGVTTYYEYDVNGRLLHIKDKDGNILKRFEYKYAN